VQTAPIPAAALADRSSPSLLFEGGLADWVNEVEVPVVESAEEVDELVGRFL
jgi:hypothetical protein